MRVDLSAIILAACSLAAMAQTPQTDPSFATTRLDELIGRWERQGAGITSVDVTFTRIDRDPRWDRTERFEGRLILKAPNLACYELRKVGRDGVARFYERLVWTGGELHEYSTDLKTHQIIEEDGIRGRPPMLASLPFLFRLSGDDLKRKMRTELVRETGEIIVLRFSPRPEEVKGSKLSAILTPTIFLGNDHASLILDKLTHRPRTFRLEGPGRYTSTYTAGTIRINRPEPKGAFWTGTPEGWKTVRSALPNAKD